ncbi:MAG TPA: von Willebrand factor type A domain-containing protein [Gemmatimonadaceae bacterium]|nr:von Willebrand factor type A domain-containing protein [Gemmatimonadaceae bacterium]
MTTHFVRAVLVSLTMLAPPLAAQGAAPAVVVISGRVTAAGTGDSLEGASVLIEGTTIGTVTGAQGRYTLRVPTARANSVTMVARLIGYEPVKQTVRLDREQITVDFALKAASMHLQEVVVTGAAVAPGSYSLGSAVSTMHAAPVEGAAGRHPRVWDREQYDRIVDNPFLRARDNPRSTFSIDVDRASYANVRRFILGEGRRPPKDAVRIEEMLNYFSFAYPEPSAARPVAVTSEVAPAPWAPSHRLVRIGLQGRTVKPERLPPSNLVFLIDVSGSMQSPDKLPLLKQAFRLLVAELRPEDRVSLVVYAGAAGVVLPPTPGDRKKRILDAIDALEAGGSTAGGAGLRLAYDIARESHLREGNNRVILATDGDFNVGVSSDAEMVRLIEEKREQGTYLTVLGFGTGNLQDAKMEKLADHGNGNYAYVDDLREARKVLVKEIGGTLVTVAKDVKLQVEFNPARVAAYRLIGYENRVLRDEDFNDDRKDAGEMGAGHSVTALYEVIPVGADDASAARGTDPLRYQRTRTDRRASRSDELLYVKLRYKAPDGGPSRLLEHAVMDRGAALSGDFMFAAAVAAFGMVLRDSEHRGSATLDDVLALAGDARGADSEGYRAEFIDIVRTMKTIAQREEVSLNR